MLLRKQRLIGEIAPDSAGFFGVPERHAGRISSSSQFRLSPLSGSPGSGPPASQLARARRDGEAPNGPAVSRTALWSS
jgi:hypothetical protein